MNQAAGLYTLSQSSTYWAQKTFSIHPTSLGRLCWTYITAPAARTGRETPFKQKWKCLTQSNCRKPLYRGIPFGFIKKFVYACGVVEVWMVGEANIELVYLRFQFPWHTSPTRQYFWAILWRAIRPFKYQKLLRRPRQGWSIIFC